MKNLRFLFFAASLMLAGTLQASSTIEVVAELNGIRPGNLTVTPAGRILFSQQPLDGPELRVVELMKDGSLQPFPNQDWADGPEKGEVGFSSVICINTTEDGIVYILDMGSETAPAQIVSWDSINNHLVKNIEIEKSAIVTNSFLQDFALDTKRNKMYIADTTLGNLVGESKSAFVVVDLTTGKSRRVLEANPALMSPEYKLVINDSEPVTPTPRTQ